MAAHNLPKVIYSVLTSDSTLTGLLTTYSGSPAVFQVRAPEDIEKFPYLVFTWDEEVPGAAQADNDGLKTEVTLTFHIWESQKGANSPERSQGIERRVIELLDRQRIADNQISGQTDYRAARAFYQGRTQLEEVDEPDRVLHTIVRFRAITWRQYLAINLTS